MYTDKLTRTAIDKCLHDNIPFVLFALPGENTAHFYAAYVGDSGCSPAFVDESDCFFINFFDNDEPYTAGVPFRYSASDIIAMFPSEPLNQPDAEIRPQIAATHRASYHYAYSNIIRRLKEDDGKVVLSRHRTILSYRFPADIAEDYFGLTDTTFRYLCFTPETGVWLGSTPELLLESDRKTSEIRTMALAGTRRSDDDSPWDEKNIYEQSFVTEFIETVLSDYDVDVNIGEVHEKKFVNIKHLCTEIKAKGSVDIPQLMAALSPTPAVAGYPRELAIDEISVYETQRRYCYGGYVGVRIGGDYHAYVNLRCCFMAPAIFEHEYFGWLCNLYAGGGIVADSKEQDEWDETEAKTDALAKILQGPDGDSAVEGQKLNVRSIEIMAVPPTF
ncbi:MAG: chorismate-binding protein [Bacteroides sp.]|nr:chorismate-binding protein [Bacteroides sp.]